MNNKIYYFFIFLFGLFWILAVFSLYYYNSNINYYKFVNESFIKPIPKHVLPDGTPLINNTMNWSSNFYLREDYLPKAEKDLYFYNPILLKIFIISVVGVFISFIIMMRYHSKVKALNKELLTSSENKTEDL